MTQSNSASCCKATSSVALGAFRPGLPVKGEKKQAGGACRRDVDIDRSGNGLQGSGARQVENKCHAAGCMICDMGYHGSSR
jgi:hypothetical protein